MPAAQAPAKAGRKAWLGLAVLALPTFVVAIDLFVLMLALPELATDLGADSNQQLWTMDIYGFLLAGFLVTMGTLGDRVGRRKLLIIGAAAFSVASVLCAYSTSPEMLIAARALLGIAGATIGPSTISLIATLFQDPKQQAAAFGLWGATFTMGAVFGPVIGGVMLAHWWWGSVFLLGVPLVLIALVLAPKLLPEYKNGEPGRLDPTSVLLTLLMILPTVYGIKELARHGWETLPVLSLLVGVAAGVAFVRRQRRLSDPLLDVRLFGNGTIGTTLGGQLAYSAQGGAIMLFMMLYFQLVDGMSTLEAGLAMVPGMVGGALGFTVAPKLAARFRPAYVIAGGLAISALVLLTYLTLDAGTAGSTALLVAGFTVVAFCAAPMPGLGTNLVVMNAPPEKAGSAGSLAQMANEFGGTLGIAVFGTVGLAVYRSQVADSVPAGVSGEAAEATRDSLAGANAAADGLPEDTAAALLAPAQDAFLGGLQTIAVVCGVILAAVAVLIAVKLKHIPPIGSAPAPEPGDAPDAGAAAEPGDPGQPGSATQSSEAVDPADGDADPSRKAASLS
ncbi:MFS transporter [Streptomyces sp. O3]